MAAITSLVTGLSFEFFRRVFRKDTGGLERNVAGTANAISDMSANSLVEFTGVARVEPITAIDATLVPYDFTTDVLKMLNSVYAGMYLSAGALATDVGRVRTTQLLDKLNPSRSMSFNLANSILLSAAASSLEGIKEDLTGIAPRPFNGDNDQNAETELNEFENADIVPNDGVEIAESLQAVPAPALCLPVYSSEASPAAAAAAMGRQMKNNFAHDLAEDYTQRNSAAVSGMRQAADLTTVANLSVGAQVILTVGDGKEARDIPITIRLIAYPTQPRVLSRIINWSERDNRLKTRLSSWRAGELAFWRDVVFNRDIFAERKAALMQDKSGLFQALTGRVVKNMAAGLVSLTPSLGTISSILVVSEDTVLMAEEQMYGKLSDFRTRQRIMNATGVMLIAVVNPVDEYVTLYTYSISLPSEFSIKQIKASGRGGGIDVAEIVKLIQAGTPPNF